MYVHDGEKHRLDTFARWLRWLLGSRFLGVGFFRVNATRIEPKKQEEFEFEVDESSEGEVTTSVFHLGTRGYSIWKEGD
jgi:hypothetical protein